MAGEPLAVDLADTLITTRDPAVDLLPDEKTSRLWWRLQQDRLPGGPLPPLEPTVELRRAIRHILDARLAGGVMPDKAAIGHVNDVAASAPSTRSLVQTPPDGWAAISTRHAPTDRPYQLSLAAAAESLIDVLTGPAQDRLRRCQKNPACSMLFRRIRREAEVLHPKKHLCQQDAGRPPLSASSPGLIELPRFRMQSYRFR